MSKAFFFAFDVLSALLSVILCVEQVHALRDHAKSNLIDDQPQKLRQTSYTLHLACTFK